MFGSSGNKIFEKLLEKATNPLSMETDWESILQMCDVIRQGDAQPKNAIVLIKKKLINENINTLIYTLQTLESLVKNCGAKIQSEIATRDFMETLKSVAMSKPDPVKLKILELIQCWSFAFRKNPNYKIVEDYYNAMKLDGLQFPKFKESDSMFDVEQAPEWKDDTCCYRCRADFTTIKRKHHCRCCGQVFCATCSSKTSTIPKFGIEKEVRVCDVCFDKLKSSSTLSTATNDKSNVLTGSDYSNAAKQQTAAVTSTGSKGEKTDEEFEEELQLALALSQSEQEEKDKKRNQGNKLNKTNLTTTTATTNATNNNSYPSIVKINQSVYDDSESELNRFLARSNNLSAEKIINSEKMKQLGGPSPPPSAPYVEVKQPSEEKLNELKEETNDQMNLLIEDIKKFLEIFVNRMKSDSMRGRSITNDTAVQSLFLQLQHLQPKLLAYVKYQEDARAYYESLQDKLTQLKDAREALNALRHDNFEKKRIEFEERERLRQLQIAQKLQDMRQQKQNYYQYQNEINLRRLQEHEREFQLRLEQQRHLVLMRDQQLVNGLPFLANQQQLPQNMYNQQMLNTQTGYPSMPGTNPNIPFSNYGQFDGYNPAQQASVNTIASSQLQNPNYPMNKQAGVYNMNALNMSLQQIPKENQVNDAKTDVNNPINEQNYHILNQQQQWLANSQMQMNNSQNYAFQNQYQQAPVQQQPQLPVQQQHQPQPLQQQPPPPQQQQQNADEAQLISFD